MPLITPSSTSKRWMRITAKMPPLFNMTITNVPGPAKTLYLDGVKMIDFSGAPMLFHGSGIAINATSYNGQLQVAINACRRIVSEDDIQKLRQYMLEAFNELEASYGV